ncbi:hypothetical protein Taro_051552 [Colocasia esculenta]|uniref:Uncharacterized protein n=1 Tax=Colocasia esculenta TaxID=4460 RepID=A0A843XHM0_COLES|nr:hypothetical protein [Colocasia esculenta]
MRTHVPQRWHNPRLPFSGCGTNAKKKKDDVCPFANDEESVPKYAPTIVQLSFIWDAALCPPVKERPHTNSQPKGVGGVGGDEDEHVGEDS